MGQGMVPQNTRDVPIQLLARSYWTRILSFRGPGSYFVILDDRGDSQELVAVLLWDLTVECTSTLGRAERDPRLILRYNTPTIRLIATKKMMCIV